MINAAVSHLYCTICDFYKPEFIAHKTIDKEISWWNKAEKNMRHKSKKMIPSWKSFSQVTLLNAASDGVNDDDIIHHDDDPGQTTDDEDDGNHDQNKRQSLLTFTEDKYYFQNQKRLKL